VRTLLDHLDTEMRGKKQYPVGEEPETENASAREQHEERRADLEAARGKVTAALAKLKYSVDGALPEDLNRAAELVLDGSRASECAASVC
jgi:hypothetical protein